jgi:hypothetical protein
MTTLPIAQKKSILDDIQIAAPCDASWEDMVGDERTRHCGECRKNVYNISAMSRFEAEQFLIETEGRACIRLYKRKDGTLLTNDCPVGLAERAWRRARATAAASLGLILTLLAGAFFLAFGKTSCRIDQAQQNVQHVIDTDTEVLMGAMPPPEMPEEILMGEPMAEPTPEPPRPTMGKPMMPANR